MTVPDEAVEVAARVLWYSEKYAKWENVPQYRKEPFLNEARNALTAAAPFIAEQAASIIADLIDSDPCSFDHNHSCQAHGYYYLAQGEPCPQHEAKEWVKTYRSGT